jgi:subfamily B ATP-binding cassette protein MsbA
MLNVIRKLQRLFKSPAYELVFLSIRSNLLFVFINLLTNVLCALLEGSSLGVVYLAVSSLTHKTNGETTDKFKLPSFESLDINLQLSPEQSFLWLVILALCLQLLLSIFSYTNKVVTAQISAKAQTFVTGKVFEQIMLFSYSCASRYKIGDLVMYANDAALAVDRQIEEINSIIINIAFSIAYLYIIIVLSPALAMAASIIIFFAILLQYYLAPRLRRLAQRVTSEQVEVAKSITENIQGLRLIHTFGTQEQTIRKIKKLLENYKHQLIMRSYLYYSSEPLLDIMPLAALAVLSIIAVLSSKNYSQIMPTLLTFLLALQRLATRLKSTSITATRFADNSGRMLRLAAILNRDDKQFEHSGNQRFNSLQGDIKFNQVSHSYTKNGKFVLHDLNFDIPRHQVTAFVGESGAGKSTILDLFLGIYQPTHGTIYVNNLPFTELNLSDFRKRVGVVSQDTFIFNDTILENLRYGNPESSIKEAISCSKLAYAHQFILSLPDGYKTVVGERGYRLSGGQRQRLALARALLKKPEILILDEATSSLDSESESLIQNALEKIKYRYTVIVVAHRLSTIVNSDQILVLKNGKIVDKGRHLELISKSQIYKRYWDLQTSVASP